MNKRRGHYCRICRQHKANEKFGGRGHAAHICKACSKRGNKPPEIKIEPPVVINVDIENIENIYDFDTDIDGFLFHIEDDEPPKKNKKRKPNKAKLLRSAQKKQAKELLNKMLENGDAPAKDIIQAANKAGIPTEALRRAKGSLGIKSNVTENGSVWCLPRRNKPKENSE
jgi:hypothetical protein